MTDEAGAAPAAAETVAQPQEQAQPAPQAQPEPKIERSKETARSSIDRAFAALDKQEATSAAPKPKEQPAKEQPVATGERERDESGRFKAKDTTAEAAPITAQPVAKAPVEKQQTAPASEPPSRFSADAKAAWKDAPAPVQAEITRAVKELEGGLAQYQQMFEPLKKHMALAKQHNTTVHGALDGYLTVERSLRSQDVNQKLTALEGIFETAGISPRDYAAHIMGQKPDEVSSRNDATIRELRQELAGLKQQLGGVSQTIQQRQKDEVEAQVTAFARDNPRLNDQEFANTVGKLIESGLAGDLKAAYEMADRLNPAPPVQQPAAPAATTQKPNPDQTRKANLSIGGAPAGGSNPATRKTSTTARDALNNAFASLGIG